MTAAHIALVGAVALSASVRGCQRNASTAVYTPVALVLDVPAAQPVVVPIPSPSLTEEPKQTRPTEVKPPPQRGRLVRRDPVAANPGLSANEIKQALALPPADSAGPQPVDELDTTYKRIIEEVFYRAWHPPSYADAGNATATASIELRAGGVVTARRLSRPSGNAVLDASVVKALESVTRIPGLSRSYIERNSPVELVFNVEKE